MKRDILKSLLYNIKLISDKYARMEKREAFNIFTILKNGNDEVNLHSKFIAELLNPEGSHNKGEEFLKAFIEVLGLTFAPDSNTWVVAEQNKIDIQVKNESQVIVIENKIDAYDQEKQLQRYNDIVKKEGYEQPEIVYLTKDGKEASTHSRGNLPSDKIIAISYAEHIKIWIEKCIEVSALQPALRETLYQYLKLIKQITGQYIMDEELEDLINLLAENEKNVTSAAGIVNNWEKIKKRTEVLFWKDLEEAFNQKFKTNSSENWEEHVEGALKNRNKNRDYGIDYDLGIKREPNFSFRFYVESNFGEDGVYYGVYVNKGDKPFSKATNMFKAEAESIQNFCGWRPVGNWLGGKYLIDNPDFDGFDENAQKLLNKEYREKMIGKNIAEMDKFIKNVRSVIKSN